MTNHQPGGPTERKKRGRKTTVRLLDARERRLKALQLRKEGWGYERIAKELGYSSRSSAYRAVADLLASEKSESVSEMRAVWNARIDAVVAAHLPRASSEEKPSARSAGIILSAARDAFRLNGLEAATKIQLELTNAIQEFLDRVKGKVSADVFEKLLLLATDAGDHGARAGADPAGEDAEEDGGDVQP